MAKKKRIPIPKELAARVLFLSDRTCCRCNTMGLPLQIHHVDEDPTNNKESNLAVLCFLCHNETMIKGGQGRLLDASQIILYRDSWLQRVQKRKEKADELASISKVTGIKPGKNASEWDDLLSYKINYDWQTLQNYLDHIVAIHRAQWIAAETLSISATSAMQGSRNLIDFYEEVLVEIASFYPKGHFNNTPPKLFFNNLIDTQFALHRLIREPKGIGTGTHEVSATIAYTVAEDLSNLIVQCVHALAKSHHEFNGLEIGGWIEAWESSKNFDNFI